MPCGMNASVTARQRSLHAPRRQSFSQRLANTSCPVFYCIFIRGILLAPAITRQLDGRADINNFMGAPSPERDGSKLPSADGQPHRLLRIGWGSRNHLSKIKHVVVPWTSSRPAPSVIRPSATPTRLPQLITVPSALIRPVFGVIGRMNETLNSRVVESKPFFKVDWIASPMQLSRSVAAKPP